MAAGQIVAGYNKAVETFAKTVNKLPATSDSSLQKALHTFGKSVTQVIFTRDKEIVKSVKVFLNILRT